MPLSKPVNTALKTWRTVFGEGTVIENWVKQFSVILRDKRSAWRDKRP